VWLKDHTQHAVKYKFTIDWCLGAQYSFGYGEYAAGHKCGHVFEGEGGQYFIQPNNRVLWMDGGSWITRPIGKPDWKVFSQEFSCEHTGSRWVSESDEELYFYTFKENKWLRCPTFKKSVGLMTDKHLIDAIDFLSRMAVGRLDEERLIATVEALAKELERRKRVGRK